MMDCGDDLECRVRISLMGHKCPQTVLSVLRPSVQAAPLGWHSAQASYFCCLDAAGVTDVSHHARQMAPVWMAHKPGLDNGCGIFHLGSALKDVQVSDQVFGSGFPVCPRFAAGVVDFFSLIFFPLNYSLCVCSVWDLGVSLAVWLRLDSQGLWGL